MFTPWWRWKHRERTDTCWIHPHSVLHLQPQSPSIQKSWTTPAFPRNIPQASHLKSWLRMLRVMRYADVCCRVCKQPNIGNSELPHFMQFQDRICTILHSHYIKFNMTSNQQTYSFVSCFCQKFCNWNTSLHYPISHFDLGLSPPHHVPSTSPNLPHQHQWK